MKYYSRIIDIGNQSVISDEKNIKVKLDDDYVWYVSLDELEDTDKIKKMGPLHVDFDEYSYVGEYNGEIDESRHELFYGRKYTRQECHRCGSRSAAFAALPCFPSCLRYIR